MWYGILTRLITMIISQHIQTVNHCLYPKWIYDISMISQFQTFKKGGTSSLLCLQFCHSDECFLEFCVGGNACYASCLTMWVLVAVRVWDENLIPWEKVFHFCWSTPVFGSGEFADKRRRPLFPCSFFPLLAPKWKPLVWIPNRSHQTAVLISVA